MAPESANQKRKRGRTANASQDASQTQLTLTNTGTIRQLVDGNNEVDVDDATRPRKRGRPAKANAPPQLESEPEPELAVDAPKKKRRRAPLQEHQDRVVVGNERNSIVKERPKSKKRGRPSVSRQNESDGDNANAIVVEEPPRPKKRGRPSLAQQHPEKSTVGSPDEPAEPAPSRRRGRPLKEARPVKEADAVAEEADDENEASARLLRRSSADHRSSDVSHKKSPRGPKKKPEPAPAAVEDEGDGQDEDSSFLRRSTRDRRSVGAWYEGAQGSEEREEEVALPKGKRQEQPSLTGKDTRLLGQKHRQRRHKQVITEQEQEKATEKEPRRKGRPRTSDVSSTDPKKSRRSLQTQTLSPSPDQASEPAPYRHLITRTRRVPRDTITNKWSPLNATSISSVADIIHSASRPVLLRLNNVQKHAQATAALNTVGNRLRSKLARGLPFPPAIVAHRREDELEFERTVNGIQTLEAQLDPLLHGVALLQREKERAEKELEKDYTVLNFLSANARSGVRERREQLRKMHALVPEPSLDGDKPLKIAGELKPAEQASVKIFVDLENEELEGIAGQISNHMESMRGNLQQIDGIVPAISEGRAALRTALLPHLSQALFEQVLLG